MLVLIRTGIGAHRHLVRICPRLQRRTVAENSMDVLACGGRSSTGGGASCGISGLPGVSEGFFGPARAARGTHSLPLQFLSKNSAGSGPHAICPGLRQSFPCVGNRFLSNGHTVGYADSHAHSCINARVNRCVSGHGNAALVTALAVASTVVWACPKLSRLRHQPR